METINDRLIKLIGNKRGIKAKLSKYLDIPDTTVSTYISRGTKIPADLIPDIARFFNISMPYLLTGKDTEQKEMEYFTQEEIKLIDCYRKLDLNIRKFVLNSLMLSDIAINDRVEIEEVIENYRKQAPSTPSEPAR